MVKHQIDQLMAGLARSAAPSSDFDLSFATVPKFDNPRPAAVLLALTEHAGELHVILTKRAQGMRHHPGQIALPGGKIEPEDASATGASLREAQEEIGLAPESVEIIGELPQHITVTGFQVQPILGLVKKPFVPVLDEGEVQEMIYAPFSHIFDQTRYMVQGRMMAGKIRHYYTIPYGPHYIWGATARMTYGMAKRIAG